MLLMISLILLTRVFNLCMSDGPMRGAGLAYWSCDDAVEMDAGWMYNWEPEHPCPGDTDIPWVPMIWGWDDLDKTSDLIDSDYDALLGFNEPNADDQAGMSAQDACNQWWKLERTGLRLGSPAATQWGAFSWTKEWLECIENKGYHVDFLTFHFYFYNDGDYTSVDDLRTFLNKIKSTYPGYTIWLTEFAHADGDTQTNVDLFNDIYDMLNDEFSDLVERYAWFTNRQTWTTKGWDLINWSDGSLTDMGEAYKSKPNNYASTWTAGSSDSDTSSGSSSSGSSSSGSCDYITITNKDGIGAYWYAVKLSNIPDGYEIDSVAIKDSDMSDWEYCDSNYDYWSCGSNPTYSAPFSFKITSTSGETIYDYDLINNLNEWSSATMSTCFGDSSSSSNGYITITNKDGINDNWYAVRISGIPDGKWISWIKMRDSNHNSWLWGSKQYDYYYWYGDGPYDPSFSFKLELSDGQEITGWNIITNNNDYSSGSIEYDESYVEDDSSQKNIHWTAIIAIIIAILGLLSIICIVLYCICIKRKQKKEISFKDEDEQEINDDNDKNKNNDETGYDMSPINVDDGESNENSSSQDAQIQDGQIEVETQIQS